MTSLYATNGVKDEMAFQKPANAHAPHIAVFEPERISGVCQASFRSHGASWYCINEASFSAGLVHAKTSRPSPTPPKTNRKIDLKPMRAQRMPRSMIDSAGASGFTQTVIGLPRARIVLSQLPVSTW